MWQKAKRFGKGDYTALTPFVNHSIIFLGEIMDIKQNEDGNSEALIKASDGSVIVKRTQTPEEEWILSRRINK